MTTREFLRITVVAVGFSCALGPPSSGQEVIDLARIPLCRDCRLDAQRVVLLGDSAGPGIIEFEQMHVAYGAAAGIYAVYQRGGHRVQLFDTTGKFVREIGKRGEGPGEITTLVDVQFNGRNLVTLDYTGSRIQVFDLSGNVLMATNFDVRAGSFRTTSDTTIVIMSMDRRPALVGYPLHTISLRSGMALNHFGSDHGEFDALEPFASDVAPGYSPVPQNLWWGQRARLHLEQWSVTGRKLRTVKGDVPWFTPPKQRNRDDSPPMILSQFGSDQQDRLVLLTLTADPKWREVKRYGAEGIIRNEDMAKYFDTRIDVFDLRSRRHLGTLVSDEYGVGLVLTGENLALQRVTYDADSVPKVTLYRLNYPPSPR